ncbi:MAG: Heavy metal transport/detoxification protein [Jatrophihabitans sp.]|jgi:copper chaperone|nr:Heavy metal transport/detoxification protein [Jatrophihabitans sp.]
MATKSYGVIGLTCEHCVAAVISEVGAINGVSDVSVTLNAGGVSDVTVTSDRPVPVDAIVGALDEAGDYTVAAESS